MNKTKSCWLYESTLEGKHVNLVPLQVEHADELVSAAADGKLWELWYTAVPDAQGIKSYIESALQEKAAGRSMPFVVTHKNSGKIIGSTRICNADTTNKRLEIGYTWYARAYQKSAVNSESKLLLLKHAFEDLSAIAVEFRTHWHNHASRAAIARLGAKQDGVLRNHLKDAEGCYRDTVVFSIINHEWLTVKRSLQHKLQR